MIDPEFGEELLRLYLGKYEHRFSLEKQGSNIAFHTGPHPKLILSLRIVEKDQLHVTLYEHIKIGMDDPWYGLFEDYQLEIFRVSIANPHGTNQMEKAITKSFLTGARG